MGREALARAEVGGEAGDVRALLESTELILRGDIRRKFPRDKLARVRVDGDFLRFDCDGEPVALQLGSTVADRWAKAIDTPPPGLRAKLGLAEGAHAFRVGIFDDAALESALAGRLGDAVENADMIIACISGPSDLDAALAAHAASPALPLWVVHPKGKGVAFGDGEIRSVLRARGFRDGTQKPQPQRRRGRNGTAATAVTSERSRPNISDLVGGMRVHGKQRSTDNYPALGRWRRLREIRNTDPGRWTVPMVCGSYYGWGAFFTGFAKRIMQDQIYLLPVTLLVCVLNLRVVARIRRT